jgi:uncharacterized YccA/Bax inhibitor family protein
MRASNPALKRDEFLRIYHVDRTDAMTIQGTSVWAIGLLLLTGASALFTWTAAGPWVMPAALAGFVVALVTIFKPQMAPYTAPFYAILEGVVLGGISSFLEMRYPGIAIQAVVLTSAIALSVLAGYRMGVLQATQGFRRFLVAATMGIALYYLVALAAGFFGVGVPLIYDTGWMGIGFSLFVVGIASMNLVLDYDLIETRAREGAPKWAEAYCAFALLVTLVWLYLEILRLLSKLNSRR